MAQAQEFITEQEAEGLTYLYDPGDDFYESIGGFSMPETLFVNSDGSLHLHKRGPLTKTEITEIIAELK